MIQNYFLMSHTNDVTNSGFKRGVQKPKINQIFCPGYFFPLESEKWTLKSYYQDAYLFVFHKIL